MKLAKINQLAINHTSIPSSSSFDRLKRPFNYFLNPDAGNKNITELNQCCIADEKTEGALKELLYENMDSIAVLIGYQGSGKSTDIRHSYQIMNDAIKLDKEHKAVIFPSFFRGVVSGTNIKDVSAVFSDIRNHRLEGSGACLGADSFMQRLCIYEGAVRRSDGRGGEGVKRPGTVLYQALFSVVYHDDLRRGKRTVRESVGLRLCGAGAWNHKDSRGSGRPDGLCGIDGPFQSILWKIWRQDTVRALYDIQQYAVHCRLSVYRTGAQSCDQPPCLWDLRPFRGNYVAGNIQQICFCPSQRRDSHVCPSGPGW